MERHRKVLCVFLALAFLMPFAGQAQAFMDDPDAIDRVVKSILMLEVYDKYNKFAATGSGFVAFDNDTLVTNFHVIDEASKIIANSDTGSKYMVTKVIAADKDKDIAILEFSTPTDLDPLPLDAETKPRRIDPVVAIGSPKGIAISASKGNISAVYEELGVHYIQFTAPISPGSSGGALFNANGCVIGITSASFHDSQNMNLAVYIGEVVDLYKQSAGNTRTELKNYHYSSIDAPIDVTPRPVPDPPSNVKGSTGVEGITITWDPAPYATLYYVYKYTSSGVIALLDKTTETRYVDVSVQEPCIYKYKVLSSDGSVMSIIPMKDLSVPSCYTLSSALATPHSFKAKASRNDVTLTWSKVKNAMEYSIYRASTEKGLYSKIADINATKYVDENVKLGESYYYRMRSKDGTNVSETSKTIKAVMPNPTPTPRLNRTP